MPEGAHSEIPIPPELAALRARIDALDAEILARIAQRYELVSEVAVCKRGSGVPVRDSARESFIIADRRRRAAALGVAPDVVESFFRLVLWASRDRQAALKAELPPDTPAQRVAIIGGRGGMGQCLAGLFGELGHEILIADHETALRPSEAAVAADVVVISVPIAVTLDVIRAVGPHVRPAALLMDVTSLKSEPLRAMLAASRASVIGTHPLFGPSVHSLQGQRIVLTPGRGEAWRVWLRRMLQARGLNVLETTAECHDSAMAVVQVLTHFSTEVLGRTLAALKVSIPETLAFTSPVYLLELLMAARHFAQSAELYAEIEMLNPQAARVTDAFAAAAAELRGIIQRQDRAAFSAVFSQMRDLFGDFTERALVESSYLIDRLVERA